jgi:hypothetical protein
MDAPENVVSLSSRLPQLHPTIRALLCEKGNLLDRITRFVDELHETPVGEFSIIVPRGRLRYTVSVTHEELPNDRLPEVPTP